MYYLCEKYYKPITVQHYVANCVSSVPRLTLLDLQIEHTNALLERNSFVCRGLTVPAKILPRGGGLICTSEFFALSCLFPLH